MVDTNTTKHNILVYRYLLTDVDGTKEAFLIEWAARATGCLGGGTVDV